MYSEKHIAIIKIFLFDNTIVDLDLDLFQVLYYTNLVSEDSDDLLKL